MTDPEVLDRVRQMRERGSTPKQIARVLGLRPAQVAPLVRQVAAATQERLAPPERKLLACRISPGWSAGLGLDEAPGSVRAHSGDSDRDRPQGGLAGILIARQDRGSRATVCGFLVDVYCLGVKNTLGPRPMGASEVDAFSRIFFATLGSPIDIPLAVAQHVVHGAVAYARDLGFSPCEDFADTAPYLGLPPTEPGSIRFGHDGVPLYYSGPYDDARTVVATLESTAGAGNYHFVAGL